MNYAVSYAREPGENSLKKKTNNAANFFPINVRGKFHSEYISKMLLLLLNIKKKIHLV